MWDRHNAREGIQRGVQKMSGLVLVEIAKDFEKVHPQRFSFKHEAVDWVKVNGDTSSAFEIREIYGKVLERWEFHHGGWMIRIPEEYRYKFKIVQMDPLGGIVREIKRFCKEEDAEAEMDRMGFPKENGDDIYVVLPIEATKG